MFYLFFIFLLFFIIFYFFFRFFYFFLGFFSLLFLIFWVAGDDYVLFCCFFISFLFVCDVDVDIVCSDEIEAVCLEGICFFLCFLLFSFSTLTPLFSLEDANKNKKVPLLSTNIQKRKNISPSARSDFFFFFLETSHEKAMGSLLS